ncbi:MAG: acyl-CoA dehydrogenase [Deltaproteobacteria bacterium]|nr:acyl-CoA dehydrogenase [Deltaproteobacteria bacterium]
MDFSFTTEQETFRQELRAWLAAKMPASASALHHLQPHALPEDLAFLKAWQRQVHEGGWTGISWPKEYGGRGASLVERVIFDQEMAAAKAPSLLNVLGLEIVGPTIIVHGSEPQKKAHLAKILSGEEIWSQGYSEPNSGSDLASLRTRALDHGDDFIVTGQKVWTSLAKYADWCLLLVRTSPDVPKHQGLSCLLVDMKSPGITVKPLRTMTGDSEFNEVFFEDVRVPKTQLLGEKDQGWRIIVTSLMFERQGLSFYFTFSQKRAYDDMLATARQTQRYGQPSMRDPHVRQKFAQSYIECELLKLNNYRALTRLLRGNPPGPEGSLPKLQWAETNQRMQELAVDIQGAHGQLYQGDIRARHDGYWQYGFLRARANSIEGGTSEIQRNIIAERVLGLPKGR